MNQVAFQAFDNAEPMDRIAPSNFKALAALIRSETGINLQAAKQTMLEGRLRRCLRVTGHDSFDAYCANILDPAVSRDEIEHLINAVTTNKTDFFRESKHFDFLVETVLPELMKEGQRFVRCWSAACSIGAEPYTLAMLLDEYAERCGGPDYRIIATDLDSNVLDTARKGIFPREMVQPVPPALRKRYVLEARKPGRAEVRIAPELRRKIGFGRLNLMDPHYLVGDPLDVIFCRNVLIYFDKPTQNAVVARLCEQLRPGGYLFLGHSETIGDFKNSLTTVGGTVFRKK